MRADIVKKYNSFYFIGIGGVSMSGLAKYLLGLGKKVGGSDASVNEFTDELLKSGVKIDFGNFPDDIENYDVVIYTDAINAPSVASIILISWITKQSSIVIDATALSLLSSLLTNLIRTSEIFIFHLPDYTFNDYIVQ